MDSTSDAPRLLGLFIHRCEKPFGAHMDGQPPARLRVGLQHLPIGAERSRPVHGLALGCATGEDHGIVSAMTEDVPKNTRVYGRVFDDENPHECLAQGFDEREPQAG